MEDEEEQIETTEIDVDALLQKVTYKLSYKLSCKVVMDKMAEKKNEVMPFLLSPSRNVAGDIEIVSFLFKFLYKA
jgi:hypothetical protein